MKKYIKQILAILAIILIVSGVISYNFLFINKKETKNTIIPSQTPAFATSSLQWKKFVDKEDGFSFEYPSDMSVATDFLTQKELDMSEDTPDSLTVSMTNINDIIGGDKIFYDNQIHFRTKSRILFENDPEYAFFGLTPKERDFTNNYSFRKIITSTSTDGAVNFKPIGGYYRSGKNIIYIFTEMCKTGNEMRCNYVFEHMLDSIEFLQ